MDESKTSFDELLERVAAAPEIEPAPALRVGQKVGARFVIEGELGAGGMGKVYLARDEELERNVAIKLLAGIANDGALDRLRDEAKAMAALSHPNVVAVHEIGTVQGRMFLAMEHMPGGSLRDLLATEADQAALLARFVEAGRGLEAAHKAGLVHRDFKPDNVLIAKDGRACVADFGLARSASAAPILAKGSPTAGGGSGESAGTPAYMAPEQLDGGAVDARSDQFSFCVALWEALCGELPFKGKKRESTPSPPTALPANIRRVLARGLAIAPDDRFPSMTALLAELEPAERDRVKLFVIAATLCVAIGAGVAVYSMRDSQSASCEAFPSAAGVWSAASEAKIRAAFLATNVPFAADVLRSIATLIPERAAQIDSERVAACRVAKHKGFMSETAYGRALACFAAHERRLAAQVARWERADKIVVERALEAMRALEPASFCGDIRYLDGLAAPPDPAIASAIEALRVRLAALDVARVGGAFAGQDGELEAVIKEARALNYAPFVAEALLLKGKVLRERSEMADAEAVLRDAYVTAQRGEARTLTADVVRELAYGLAISGGDAEAAKLWRDLLAIDAEKEIGGPMVAFSALDSLAAIYDFQGDYDRALEARQRGFEIATSELTDSPLVLARAEASLGLSYHAVGKLVPAAESYTKALAIIEAAVGPDHPSRALLLDNAGLANGELGKTKLAITQLTEGMRIAAATYGERSIDVGYSLLNVGVAHAHGGDNDKAIDSYLRSRDIVVERLGATHPDVALVDNSLGVAYEALGRLDEAFAAQAQALAIVTAANPDHPDAARIVSNQGEVKRKAKDYPAALALFSEALARWKKLGDESPNLIGPLVGLGETLIELGRKREAIGYLEQAVSLSVESSPELAERAAKALARANE